MPLQKFVLVPFAKFIKNHQTIENGGELTVPLVHTKASLPPRTLKPTTSDCGSTVYVDSVKADGLASGGLDDITQTPRPVDQVVVDTGANNISDTKHEKDTIRDIASDVDNVPVNSSIETPEDTDNVAAVISKGATSQKNIKTKKPQDIVLSDSPTILGSLAEAPSGQETSDYNKKESKETPSRQSDDTQGDTDAKLDESQ